MLEKLRNSYFIYTLWCRHCTLHAPQMDKDMPGDQLHLYLVALNNVVLCCAAGAMHATYK